MRVDSGYANSARLAERRKELRRSIEGFGSIISPIVLNGEGNVLVDGFCRLTTLKEMKVPKVYAYVG